MENFEFVSAESMLDMLVLNTDGLISDFLLARELNAGKSTLDIYQEDYEPGYMQGAVA